MQVTACAVGQSSATILADAISGKGAAEILAIRGQIDSWLNADASPPDWPGFEALHPVREHTGRYGALLLPWNAAIEALSSRAPTS